MVPEQFFHIGGIILGVGMGITVVNGIVANIRRFRGANSEVIYKGVNRGLIVAMVFVALGGALMAAGKFLVQGVH